MLCVHVLDPLCGGSLFCHRFTVWWFVVLYVHCVVVPVHCVVVHCVVGALCGGSLCGGYAVVGALCGGYAVVDERSKPSSKKNSTKIP